MPDAPAAFRGHAALGGIRLVFGGNVFGWTIDRDQSFAVLDTFFECGGRMIDSAEGYSSWVPGNRGGESETIIGEWMESRGVRARMLVATKTGMGGSPGGLRPEKVAAAFAGSCERLRSETIDLYYAHRDDPETPLDEVVAAYGDLVAGGRVREIGASNFTAGRLRDALGAAARLGVAGYSVSQPQYNLIWRDEFEGPLQDLCRVRGIAALPYYGLASGFLTGKYADAGAWAGSGRAHALGGFSANGGWRMLAAMRAIAADTGVSLAAIALAWLNSRDAVAAPLASATNPAQVREICAGAALELGSEHLGRLDEVWTDAMR